LGFYLLTLNAVRNIQSTMLRQISIVVEDEVSEMAEPDVISASPQQSQSEYGSVIYVVVVIGYCSSQHALSLWELACHMGSQSVTCHFTGGIFAFFPSQLKLVLELATPEGCKAELN